jgi:hypothetical protein
MLNENYFLPDEKIPYRGELEGCIRKFASFHSIPKPHPRWGYVDAADYSSADEFLSAVEATINHLNQRFGADRYDGNSLAFAIRQLQANSDRFKIKLNWFSTLVLEGQARLVYCRHFLEIQHENGVKTVQAIGPAPMDITLWFDKWNDLSYDKAKADKEPVVLPKKHQLSFDALPACPFGSALADAGRYWFNKSQL